MTMIEIVIAVMILCLGVLPLYQVFMNSNRDAQRNRNRSYAAAMASSVIERYRGVTKWDKPEAPYEDLIAKFPKGAYDGALRAGPQRHVGKSVPELLDEDFLLSPWNSQHAPQGVDAQNKHVTAYGTLVKDKGYRRLAYFEQKNPRLGAMVCTVVWREQGTLPGVFSSDSQGPNEVSAQYTLAMIVGDPIFPGGKDLEGQSGGGGASGGGVSGGASTGGSQGPTN